MSPFSSIPNPLIIAVDGGQSSTLALAATPDGRIVGVGRAGASNHIHEPGGVERLTHALTDSIAGALAGHSADQVVYACLGLSGGPEIAQEIGAQILPYAKIFVCKDLVTALAGASIGGHGVIVIAGTGAAAFGLLPDGTSALADGWGYLMGDDGSAYSIGVEALKAAARAADGRDTPTTLLNLIPAHFGLPDLRAVHRAVYSHQLDRAQIASLAAVVSAAAAEDDKIAQRLLVIAGTRLSRTALAVIQQLCKTDEGLPVYVTGGVFAAEEYVLAHFKQVIRYFSPASSISLAQYSPVIGGVFLALRGIGIEISEAVLTNIDATMPADAIHKHRTQEGLE
jgi:N-acetylglucosamine kinase-like BadF-type ATPase